MRLCFLKKEKNGEECYFHGFGCEKTTSYDAYNSAVGAGTTTIAIIEHKNGRVSLESVDDIILEGNPEHDFFYSSGA